MRLAFTILMLLGIIAAAGWLLWNWEQKRSSGNDPWDAIPSHTAVIISIPDAWRSWDRFTHTSQLWGAFEQIPAFAAAGNIMATTVERMQNDAALREALEDAPMLICVLHGGEPGPGVLFIGSPKSDARSPLTAFSEIMGLDAAAKNSLSRGEVVQVRPDTALPALSLCLKDRIWLMATSVQVMDEAILQLKSGTSILQDSLMRQVRGTVGGGADAHVLLDLRKAARLLERWLDRDAMEDLYVPDGRIALDMRARPDAILMSGLLAPAGVDRIFQTLRSQGTGTIDVKRMLPASVSAFDVRHISDAQQALTTLNGQDHEPEFAGSLFNWVNGSIGRAWAQNDGGPPLVWAFFQAGDPEEAHDAIMTLCDPDQPCEQIEYRGTLMHRTSIVNALPQLLGPAYERFERPWWTMLGDVVIWSPTPDALRASIDAWNDGNSLAVEPRSTAWDQQITNTTGRTLWLDLARSRSLIRPALGTTVAPEWDELESFLEQIGGISIQISPGQRGYYHVVAGIQHAPLEQKSNGLLWGTEIGASVERAPMIVRNHNNNTNEVLVQDVTDKLHLIGSTGKILWSRQLDGPIMGVVHQVDRYKNDKLQLLFNTSSRIHLIDRNGKDVGGFPVRLVENAAAPLSVFDYEKDLDYRVMIPTEHGRILNFTLDGEEVKGWEKLANGAPAACSVEHLRIKNKDYLVFADQKGQLHILDRRGTVRERTALNLGPSPKIDRIIQGQEIMSTTIIWTDTAGVLQQGSFDGPVIPLTTKGVAGRYSTQDIDGDGEFELIRQHHDSLEVSRAGKLIYLRTYGHALNGDLRMHALGPQKFAMSMVDTTLGRVSLIDDTGRDLPGLPIAGMALPVIADLNLDKIPEIVTIDRNGKVMAHSLNGL